MRGHPPEHYAQVAEVYDEALEAGDPPTQAVAEAFAVPYTTAARWVRRTRALGLLPPPKPGLPHGNRLHPVPRTPGPTIPGPTIPGPTPAAREDSDSMPGPHRPMQRPTPEV